MAKCVRFFITKCDNFTTECGSYHKMRQLYYKCGSYYKMQRLLKIATVHTLYLDFLLKLKVGLDQGH